jgi:methyl-accepting chemotaxis protein
MSNWNNDTVLTAFVALTGVALLVQAILLLALFVSMSKAVRSLKEQVEELRSSAMPVVGNLQRILERVAPHVEPVSADIASITSSLKTASGNLAEITGELRAQAADVQVSAAEVVERVRAQAFRVDTMITTVLDSADRAGAMMQSAVSIPARQLSGVLAALKAVVESLRNSGPRPAYPAQDRDRLG